mmetsp:Transcript_78065/g.137754  ORF Transcript_78065/g.137754 Transcript_78065/m.137754 type:complete len:166 (-) Transcript_78065:222-719(-)
MAILAGDVPDCILAHIAALKPTVERQSHAQRIESINPATEKAICEKVWSNKQAVQKEMGHIAAKTALVDAVAEVQRMKSTRALLCLLSGTRIRKDDRVPPPDLTRDLDILHCTEPAQSLRLPHCLCVAAADGMPAPRPNPSSPTGQPPVVTWRPETQGHRGQPRS